MAPDPPIETARPVGAEMDKKSHWKIRAELHPAVGGDPAVEPQDEHDDVGGRKEEHIEGDKRQIAPHTGEQAGKPGTDRVRLLPRRFDGPGATTKRWNPHWCSLHKLDESTHSRRWWRSNSRKVLCT